MIMRVVRVAGGSQDCHDNESCTCSWWQSGLS